MLLLGIDTATLTLSLALVDRGPGGDRLLERVVEPPPTPHSSVLPAAFETMLGRAGKTAADLGGVVVGIGPGSFTGLRIGLATAKGLCYAASIPLVGGSSLGAMAGAAVDDVADGALLVPCLDARKGEVYCGFWRKEGGGLVAGGPEAVMPPEQLVERLGAEAEKACVFGIGREAYEPLRALPGPKTSVKTPDAFALVRQAREIPAFNAQAVFALEPHYVRPSDAEWTIRTKKPKA